MNKKIYCGYKKLKKGQKRGTLNECTKNKQIRYYGIKNIGKIKNKGIEKLISEMESKIKSSLETSKIKHELTNKEYNDLLKEYEMKDEDIFTYKDIHDFASLLPEYLYPVGSYVRKKEYPGDLDIVTTINLEDVLKWFLDNFNVLEIIAKGNKHLDLRVEYNNKSLGINIWRGTVKELPYLTFSYFYPRTLNIALRKKAKTIGYFLSQYKFTDKKGKLIPVKSFKTVFKKLGILYRTPEEQEIRETKYKHIKDGKKALKLIRLKK